MTSADPHRHVVLDAARSVLDGKLTRGAFFALLGAEDYAERRLARIIGRIEHLPSKSILFGVGTKEYEREMAELRALIDDAEKQ